MYKKIILAFGGFFVIFGALLSVDIVRAQQTPICDFDPVTDPLGLACASATGLKADDPRLIAGRIINVTLGILGILATVLIVYAGFRWMTAGGNEENVKTAQKILISAVIGLLIILTAYSVTAFVIKKAYSATTGVQYGTPVP